LLSCLYEKRELETDQRIINSAQVLLDSGLNKGKTNSPKIDGCQILQIVLQRIYELPIIV
jgi:hypothetical protein